MADPLRGYAICTTPRTGSNYLDQLLSSTGVLGHPLEYFNGPGRRGLGLPDYPLDGPGQLRAVTTLGRTDNGVYGVKLFPKQFDAVPGWVDQLPGLAFVHLEREDVLGQALSWARAEQTSQFRSTGAITGHLRYEGGLIASRLEEVVVEQARWRHWFARNDLRPLRLTYEQVVADPQAAVQQVASIVGLSEPALVDHDQVDLEVQRDDLTQEWRRRFVREAGDLSRMPSWSGDGSGRRARRRRFGLRR